MYVWRVYATIYLCVCVCLCDLFSVHLPPGTFSVRPADYLFMLIFCGVIIVVFLTMKTSQMQPSALIELVSSSHYLLIHVSLLGGLEVLAALCEHMEERLGACHHCVQSPTHAVGLGGEWTLCTE